MTKAKSLEFAYFLIKWEKSEKLEGLVAKFLKFVTKKGI